MKLYLAGPMRGIDQFNFPAFHTAAQELRSYGATVVSPAEHDEEQGFDPTLNSLDGFDLAAALSWDLTQILHEVDAIALLPGWEASSGVAAEVATARAVGKEVFEYRPQDSHLLLRRLPPVSSSTQINGDTRVVNAATGGAKGSKLARFDLLPAGPLIQLAEHYGRGAAKYADRNWELGYDWSLAFAAMMRHAWAFWNGEDNDAETGSPHMAAVAFHAFTLMEFPHTHPELDNRPRRG
jgi:hypothetical protein